MSLTASRSERRRNLRQQQSGHCPSPSRELHAESRRIPNASCPWEPSNLTYRPPTRRTHIDEHLSLAAAPEAGIPRFLLVSLSEAEAGRAAARLAWSDLSLSNGTFQTILRNVRAVGSPQEFGRRPLTGIVTGLCIWISQDESKGRLFSRSWRHERL